MSFALTNFVAVAVEQDEAITGVYEQKAEFTITGTTADVALDLGTLAGTFWTAAVADATYGTAAAAALKAWTDILASAQTLLGWASWELQAGFKPAGGAAIGAGLYKQNGTALAPGFVLNAGEGLTAYTIVFKFRLKRGARPTRYGLSGV